MDIVDPATRSRMMSGIRGKNTKPELTIRRLLHAAGFRFRLQRKDLPGKPDLVLPKYHVAILVHGCFWHMHDGCHYFRLPTTRTEFWQNKLGGNRLRDSRSVVLLNEVGWRVLVVWECAVRDLDEAVLLRGITGFIKGENPAMFAEVASPGKKVSEKTSAK